MSAQPKPVETTEPTGESDFPALTFVDNELALTTVNTLLYGPPGSGKTRAAVTAPGPVIVLNAEGPGALAPAKVGTGGRVIEIEFSGRATLKPFCRYVKANPHVAQTVVLDTLGAIYRRLLDEVGHGKPQIQHYGQVNKMVADLVMFLRDQPVNVVLCAHEKIDDQEGDRIVRPLTGGQQLPEQVMSEMDIVAYCAVIEETDDTPRRWVGQLVQAKGRRAKDRSASLGVIRDLDLSEWIAAYRAALAPDDSDVPFGELATVETIADVAERDGEPVDAVVLDEDAAAEDTRS